MPGLRFGVVGTCDLYLDRHYRPGDTLTLEDPEIAEVLVAAGHLRVLDANGDPIDKGDEMILLEFACAGVEFKPDDWAKTVKKATK